MDMAIIQSVEYTSDVSHERITNVVSVGVVYNGKQYVVDLNGDDIDTELDMITLKEVIKIGREESARQVRRGSIDAELHRKARLWALDNDMQVGQRGIVPQEIIDAYKEYCEEEGIPFE